MYIRRSRRTLVGILKTPAHYNIATQIPIKLTFENVVAVTWEISRYQLTTTMTILFGNPCTADFWKSLRSLPTECAHAVESSHSGRFFQKLALWSPLTVNLGTSWLLRIFKFWTDLRPSECVHLRAKPVIDSGTNSQNVSSLLHWLCRIRARLTCENFCICVWIICTSTSTICDRVVWCSVLQCSCSVVAGCCSVLQCVAVCYSAMSHTSCGFVALE